MMKHTPVMLQETLDAIPFQSHGIYLDSTFGTGGHSRSILENMSASSKLYAVDNDQQAIAQADQLARSDQRLIPQHANFSQLTQLCREWGIVGKVTAILADLGISSAQLDDPKRGFAFRHEAALDMRIDQTSSPSAGEWLNRCSRDELYRVLKDLGQLRKAGAVTNTIVAYRRKQAINSTRQLADLVAAVEPAPRSGAHPAVGVFRAIRMHINHELENLNLLLNSLAQILTFGGRLLLICFHSLEVRATRSFLRPSLPHKLPISGKPNGSCQLVRKVVPSDAEIEKNPRARSASLYVIEKIGP